MRWFPQRVRVLATLGQEGLPRDRKERAVSSNDRNSSSELLISLDESRIQGFFLN